MKRLVAFAVASILVSSAYRSTEAQAPKPAAPSKPPTAVERLGAALTNNPITAPYRYKVFERKGRIVLQGRVGSTKAHDAAVMAAVEMNLPLTDELVTDTREAARVAIASDGPAQLMPDAVVRSNQTYVYPEPLFGRLDEPFAGMEPPILTYDPDFPGGAFRARVAAATDAVPKSPLPRNLVDVAIDPRGVAMLRVVVPTPAARDEVAQQISVTPGVSGVINRITTEEEAAATVAPATSSDTPPPPPSPMPRRIEKPASPAAPVVPKGSALQGRVNQALQRVPSLRGVGISAVEVSPGVMTLKGRVAGPKEAMLAYRAAGTAPGVVAVGDELEFPPPDESKRNPLTIDTDPADLEPFLSAQIGRHLNDLAHVDKVYANGERVDLRLTLERIEDKPRAEALLRSMSLLRGFRLSTEFRTR